MRACASVRVLLIGALAFAGPALSASPVEAMTDAPPPPPALTSLAATPSPARSGDVAVVTATTDRSLYSTGYSTRIIDPDSGSTLASCTSGTSCTYSATIGWQNHNLQDRHFTARVVHTSSGLVVSESTLTLPVVRYDFALDVSATPNPVRSGDAVTVKAAWNRSLYSSGLSARIIDADTGTTLASCSSGSSCTYSFTQPWQNHDVQDRRFKAQIVRTSDSAVQESALLTLGALPHDFDLELTGTPNPASSGDGVTVTATWNRSLYSSGLSARIIDADTGTTLASCSSGSSCTYSFAQPWQNHDVKDRRFMAQIVRTTGGAVQESAELTIAGAAYNFGLALAAAPKPASVGDAVTLTATWNRSSTAPGSRLGSSTPTRERRWPVAAPGRVAHKQPGQNCDEFPFYATAENGPESVPPTHLKAISGVDNQLQGSRFSTFRSVCNMNQGDEFWVIPLEPELNIPTLPICNGLG